MSRSRPLTRAIQQLEEELGGLRRRRERRLTHLTDFGRLIEPHLHQLFADAEAAKTTAKKFLILQEAQIRLGVIVRSARTLYGLPGGVPCCKPRMRADPDRRRARRP
jgi:DNA-binding transcriptional LysR family regulator